MLYRSKIATVYLLGFALDLVNMFIAAVAYPEIGHVLGATVAQLTWVGNAYMLGLTVVIPLSVWLAGAYGERRLMMASLSLFALASLMAGAAGSIEALIGWRLLQGLGGGLLIPVGQAMAYRHYLPSERAGLTSLVMMVALIVPALSPALGGLMVDHLSWRWIFFANLPLALIALMLAGLWLKPDAVVSRPPPLDIHGLALGVTALVTLLIGFTLLGEAATSLAGWAWLVAAAAITLGYVRHAFRQAHPVLDLRLLQGPLLRASMLVYLFVPGVFMGTSMVAMLYLQGALGMTAASTGALMLPWALASFLAITFTRKCFNRVGPKPLLAVGILLQAVGMLLLSAEVCAGHYPWLVGAYALMGLGGSLCSSTAQSTAFLDAAPERMRQASALWNINRQLSFCLGVAMLGMLLNVLWSLQPAAATASSHPLSTFRHCFQIAAALTLVPLPWVLRIRTQGVLALLRESS